jgi:hypothetical protein
MFDPKSRYAPLLPYPVVDRRGRVVSVVPVPPKPRQALLGFHKLRQGQRLDHLAFHYLEDPAGFWRICELADAMLAEALTEAHDIPIPTKVL